MSNEDKSFDRLNEVSRKKAEWATLPAKGKLAILEEIFDIATKELEFEEWLDFGKLSAKMMGFDTENTSEGGFEASQNAMQISLTLKGHLDMLILAYKIRAGLAEPPKKLTKGNFETKKAINGQIVVKTFPLLPEDTKGLTPHFHGEVWMDSSKIQNESQVEAFAFDKAWEYAAGDEGGLMIILGAGNQAVLIFTDVLDAMFTRDYVVYLKQHAIRNYVNGFMEKILAPLISRGYLALEAHTTNERCSNLVYHPDVDALHITGGKTTHDLLVWGVDPKEREQNLKANTPKIENVTSELGAVSPWVLVPGNYTKDELKSQASMMAMFIHTNASCNCNAPKCIVVADEWDQKDEYIQIVEDELANHGLPVAYYPNTEQRWEKFSEQYPDCKKIESNTGMGIAERKLSGGGLNEKPLLLPYLKMETKVDLESIAGRVAASKEFAFTTEPFAPVFTVATLKGTSQNSLMQFVKTASTFCNDYLYGTLSGAITTPPSLLEDESVQTLIAEMKYGTIAVNNWSGFGYVMRHAGMWGGFPGETLDAVESGIGKVGNTLAIPHFEKFVVVSPITHTSHMKLEDDYPTEKRKMEAVGKFFLYGGIGNFIELISAVTGVELLKVGLVGTSVAVAAFAYFFHS